MISPVLCSSGTRCHSERELAAVGVLDEFIHDGIEWRGCTTLWFDGGPTVEHCWCHSVCDECRVVW